MENKGTVSKLNFGITRKKILSGVPSASGLVKHGAFFYVLGDDAPFLFKLSREFDVVNRVPLLGSEQRERIPKPDKPDFEALEIISANVIAGFGSGSLSPQRDRMVRINLGGEARVETFSLTPFYASLKDLEVMRGSELNIEAAAFHANELYLFNRRKNVIFSFSFPQFISALESGSPFPAVKASAFELPEINGIEAGFSGATITASGKLIVTCSVEDTYNAYDDGEVLGSFIGISSGVKNDIFEFSWIHISSELPLKVESVCVEQETSEAIDVVLVTDSDGAESLILKGKLSY